MLLEMLTIKRVPTVVSNFQEEGRVEGGGCGRNCLGKCCLPFSKLPLYEFKGERVDVVKDNSIADGSTPADFLDTLVLGQWEDRMSKGLFRYDVTACETKIIPGTYGFIAQLNEGRHLKKRPTEFRVDRVLQPFDQTKFNFTKVGQEEVLFCFQESKDGRTCYLEKATAADSPNVVMINVSPIEYGHVLLIPRVLNCFPQRIDRESLRLALHMAREAQSPYFRLGYNSLGAFATINHLHFQAYYLKVPFPVEKAPMKRVATAEGTDKALSKISIMVGYPVRGLVFEAGNTSSDLSSVVSTACIWLQENNVPFNVLIADCGRKIFLFPQCYAEKQALGEVSQKILDTQVNPAVWEISGHIVLKRRNDYDDASEDYAWKLLAEVSLSEERFQEVYTYLSEAMGLKELEKEEGNCEEKEEAMLLPPEPHFPEGCSVQQ